MKRALFSFAVFGALAANSMAATPDACALLTAKDASALAGQPLTPASNSGGTGCRYKAAGGPAVLGVEIHVKVDGDAAAAHAEFPRWVMPYQGASGPAVTQVKNLGDEAAIRRSAIAAGVDFRRGAVLVKIGVHPPVADDAALKTAAAAVLGRL